jgi:D-alanine-D-alanine ligase
MPAENTRLAVLFGGPSPEHDVSVLTGLLATHDLLSSAPPSRVRAIYWSKNGAFFEVDPALEGSDFIEGVPPSATALDLQLGPDGGFMQRKGRFGGVQRAELDVVVICCHGGPGEDGTLQGALDLAGLSYTGPNAMGAALGMDKLATSALLQAAGVPVLPRSGLDANSTPPRYPGPFIVKPRFGGSSIGIEVVADFPTAQLRRGGNLHLRRGAVIEPYRGDLYDLQIAVRTWPEVQLSAIERPERQREGAEILDYKDKYVGGVGMHAAARELPAKVSDDVADRLRSAALACVEALRIRGVARIDFLSDGNELFLNEVNTVPGSLSRYLFIDPQLSFAELLDGLIDEALKVPAATYSAAGADGSVLRSAGSIASKLG